VPCESVSFSEEELRDLKAHGVGWEAIEKDLEALQEK
jgi:hypothetical protein